MLSDAERLGLAIMRAVQDGYHVSIDPRETVVDVRTGEEDCTLPEICVGNYAVNPREMAASHMVEIVTWLWQRCKKESE